MDALNDPDQFRAGLEIEDGRAVVALSGDLDVSAVRALQRVVVSALDFRPAELTIDMTGVTFLDPAGVSGLMSVASMATEADCRIGVRGASPAAARVLRLLDVDDTLPLERSFS